MFTATLSGQTGKGYFDQWGLGDGLSQVTVHCVFQDSYGFLWVGTEDGLNMYDGYRFRVFQHDPARANSISNNVVYSIFEDEEGILWIGTASGLNCYDRFTKTFRVYRYSSEMPGGISDNSITSIAPAGAGHLWVGTRNGLNLMNKADETFRVFRSSGDTQDFNLSSNIVNDLLVDEQGRLWCATSAGLNVFNPVDSTFQVLSHLYGSENAIANPVVHCLEMDREQKIWVGTEAGISVVTADLQVQPILEPDLPDFEGFNKSVLSLEATNDYLVWVGTDTELLCLDDQGNIIAQFDRSAEHASGLHGGSILSLLEDESGALWIGTFSGGLFRFTTQQQIFSYLTMPEDSESRGRSEVWCAEEYQGRWLIGSSRGLFRLNEKDGPLEKINVRKGNRTVDIISPVRAVVEIDGYHYIGLSGQGLMVINDKGRLQEHFVVDPKDSGSINSNRVTCLLPDSSGLWVGTAGGGLNYFNPETKTFEHWKFAGSSAKNLPDNHVTALAKDRNRNLWVGMANRGVSKMNVDDQTFRHFDLQPKKQGSLSAGQVNDLFVDSRNRLWVGTKGGGLNVMQSDSAYFEVFRSFHGLPSNTVSAIAEDEQGVIWASTNAGLVRMNYDQLDFRKFNQADGLQHLEFMPGAVGKMQNGDLWFGSSEGVVVLNSAVYEPNTYTPLVVFSEVTVTSSEEGIQREASYFPKPQTTLEFNHDIVAINIEFAMLDLMQSEKNNYAYRVNGLMDNWANLGHLRQLTLSNLNPGHYAVMVKGANHDGVWNEQHSELQIVIHPAFWQTLWFKLLVLFAMGGGIYLMYRWRVAQIKAHNKMLESVVKERTREIAKERDEKAVLLKEIHHRVKNNLQIISSLLSLQSRMSNDPKVESLFLESTNRVQSMSMIHEKMYRSENLKEVNLKQYITELLETLVEAYNVGRKIETEVVVNVDRFAVDTLTPLGLIINELVSNSLKYAFKNRENGKLTLRLEGGDDENYHLYISDNGVGFKDEDVREGAFGTELVEDLATQLQGSIEQLETEQGTSFHLVFQNVDHH